MKYLATVEGEHFEIEIKEDGELFVNGEKRRLDMRNIGGLDLYSILADNTSYEVFAEEEAGQYQIQVQGELLAVGVKDAVGVKLRRPQEPEFATGSTREVTLTAPIPGVVVGVYVVPGDRVQAGQVVAVLESMKMENELKAPCDGVVREVKVEVEDAVDRGHALVIIGAGANG
jgi:biotin carboxyl carrier protein